MTLSSSQTSRTSAVSPKFASTLAKYLRGKLGVPRRRMFRECTASSRPTSRTLYSMRNGCFNDFRTILRVFFGSDSDLEVGRSQAPHVPGMHRIQPADLADVVLHAERLLQ